MLFSCLLPAKQIAGSSLLFYWSLFKIIFFRCQNLIRAIWIAPQANLLFRAPPNFSYFGWNQNEWFICSSWHPGCLKWKGLAEVSCPAGRYQMLYSSPMTVAETVWRSNWKRRLIKVSRRMVWNVIHSFIIKPYRGWGDDQKYFLISCGADGLLFLMVCLLSVWIFFPDFMIYWIQCQILRALFSRHRHTRIADFFQML